MSRVLTRLLLAVLRLSLFASGAFARRVEFEDGSVWQRKDWNYDDVKLTAKPANSKTLQMCRGL